MDATGFPFIVKKQPLNYYRFLTSSHKRHKNSIMFRYGSRFKIKVMSLRVSACINRLKYLYCILSKPSHLLLV